MFQKKQPFPPKKKPAPDLSEPESFEAKPAPKMAAMKPAMHEEAEEPAEEATEDYGAKLLADIEAAGESHGLDAQQSRAVAASMFSAAAKCLGGGEPVAEHDAGGESFEAEEE